MSELVYKKVGRKYVSIGQLECLSYADVVPHGIEMIIRDGSGGSRHWRFASLDQVQKDYDWFHEALKFKTVQDLAPMLLDIFQKNQGLTFAALSEVVAEALIQGEMKNRKRF
jgi:hypothetical protein